MKGQNNRPPKLPEKILKWFIKGELREEILGDLHEYYMELEENTSWKRRLLYWFHFINFFRPFALKQLEGSIKLNYYGMFKHNLLITLRGFKRHKTVFGINLIGLVTSLTCVLFSTIWIMDELKKDRFHNDTEKLFQVYTKFLNSEGTRVWQGITGLIKPEIERQLPQVEISTVFTDPHEYTLSVANQGYKITGRFADEDYLSVFSYPLVIGESSALKDPSSILITQSLANRLFKSEDVIGETIQWHSRETEKTFRVAGVLKDLTSATSEKFEYILPWAYYHDELINYKDWGNFYGRVVVKLDPWQKTFTEGKINEIFQENEPNDQVELFLTSYADQYLYSNYEDGKQAGGRIDYVNLTAIVAVFILLIACINFINLSTAFASLKTKEIGVKKTFGATRSNLAFQFF
ncbi:MAG: ABC transporter permease, partial [Bacteroidota bacterium]